MAMATAPRSDGRKRIMLNALTMEMPEWTYNVYAWEVAVVAIGCAIFIALAIRKGCQPKG